MSIAIIFILSLSILIGRPQSSPPNVGSVQLSVSRTVYSDASDMRIDISTHINADGSQILVGPIGFSALSATADGG